MSSRARTTNWPRQRATTAPRTTPRDATALVGTGWLWFTLSVATLIVAAVVLDALRLPINARNVGLAACGLIGSLAVLAWRSDRSDRGQHRSGQPHELAGQIIAFGVVAGVIGWRLVAPALPSLLPVGNSPDAVHHTALASYIYAYHHLVHADAAARALLIEMADYPPGFAVLAALTAQATALLPVQVIFPLAALAVAASVVGVALLIAQTVDRAWRPLAMCVALLVLLMPDYSLGAIQSEHYFPQMLAHWLIVAVGVALLRYTQQSRLDRVVHLILLLLALVWTYTPYLGVVLLPTALVLLLAPTSWRQRLGVAGAVVALVALLALGYSRAHASVGSVIVLHEGSTVRDPLGAMGVALPALAALGVLRGSITRGRRIALLLLLAALAQQAALWLLWQHGTIAGYTYYKGYYLIALLLPLPVAWLLADGLGWINRWRLIERSRVVAQPLVLLLLALILLHQSPLASTTQPAAYPITPDVLQAAQWVRDNVAPDDVAYALAAPGLPAYWLHVGVLLQPRNDAAMALLHAPPTSFMAWYLNPEAARTLLLQQPTPPDLIDGLAVRYQNTCCVVLQKTDAYPAAMQRRSPLLITYQAAVDPQQVRLDALVMDQIGQADLHLRLLIDSDEQPIVAHTIDVPQQPAQLQHLGFALDQMTLAATGYSDDTPLRFDPPAAVPAAYRLRLQLLHGAAVVQEQTLGTRGLDQLALAAPSGTWALTHPAPAAGFASLDMTLDDVITLVGAQVDRTTLRAGETLTLRLKWRAQQAIDRHLTVFVQLIAADGGAAFSIEGDPAAGAAPTWRWQANEEIGDTWQMRVPESIQPGAYQLVVGMYDRTTGQRLEAWRRSPNVERFWTDVLPLSEIRVTSDK